jgi:membrane-associated phospholipid phosphatase
MPACWPCSRRYRPRRLAPALFALLALLLSCGAPTEARAADSRGTVRKVGDVGQFAPLAGALALIASHHDGKGLTELALSSATTLALVHTLKPIINRTRPNGGSRSFPSGHTAIAIAGAGFVQRRYGWAWGAPAYAVTAFVAYSRVYSKQHYTTDVLASGAIGIASNLVFTHRYRGVGVTPTALNGAPGLTLSITW